MPFIIPYIVVVGRKTKVVRYNTVMDGAMVEFFDACTGEPAGSAGINWWNDESNKVEYNGPLPQYPPNKKWG